MVPKLSVPTALLSARLGGLNSSSFFIPYNNIGW